MEHTEWYQNYSGYGKIALKVLLVRNFWMTWQPLFYKETESLVVDFKYFLFSFLHCMEAISPLIHVKVDVVQLRCRGWTQNGATGCEQKAKRFVMNSALPATTKIFTLFIKALHKEALILLCLCLLSVYYYVFLTCFICVHTILLLFLVLAFKEGNSVDEKMASRFSVLNSL